MALETLRPRAAEWCEELAPSGVPDAPGDAETAYWLRELPVAPPL